jgi:hypothetical protein
MTIPLSAQLGTGEIARLVGCSREYVARQCRERVWPHAVFRNRYRFTRDHVAIILAMSRKERVADPRRAACVLLFDELPTDALIVEPRNRRPAIDVHRYSRMRYGE